MDNLTHSLAGFAVVECARPRSLSRKAYLLAQFVSFGANNLPDLDFVYSRITEGKLGYLLHHRGHTHTLPVTLLLSALLASIVIFLARRSLSRAEKFFIFGVGILGGLLHLFLDSWNIYGVHPFWPVYDGWLYGDSVFIVEPFLWMLLLPLVFLSELPRKIKAVAGILLVLAIGLFWKTGFLLTPIAVVLTLFPLIFLGIRGRISFQALVRIFTTVASSVVLFYFVTGHRIESELRRSKGNISDVMLSPLPANPFCWTAIVAFETDTEVGYRRGLISAFPGLLDVAKCPRLRGDRSTAPFTPLSGDATVLWSGELRLSKEKMARLAADNCYFSAFLKFSRAPFFIERGEELVMGDLRFDWEEELSFAEMSAPLVPTHCPKNLPPWVPPRRGWIIER